jgi:hypothetical protein
MELATVLVVRGGGVNFVKCGVVLKSGSDVAVRYSSAHNAVQQLHVT